MGWLWSSKKDDDPVHQLDSSLRDFLEEETINSSKFRSEHHPSPPVSEQQTPSFGEQVLPQNPTSKTATPAVPPESQFPDGRYAHLWATYKPLSVVEAAGKTDQERLLDVLQGYKERKAEIGRAALENCALEQEAVNECFKSGGWKSRMSMCRAENRCFERCYEMQGKFLKALGYLSSFNQTPETKERIQMHADTLYHRMLAQEKVIQEAKVAGLPPPSFPPIIHQASQNPSPGSSTTPLQATPEYELPGPLPPQVQARLKTPLDKLSSEERVLEEEAIRAQMQAELDVHRKLGEFYEEQKRTQEMKRERLRERFGDRVASWLGW